MTGCVEATEFGEAVHAFHGYPPVVTGWAGPVDDSFHR